ncbi:hypothetical protein [Caballeronia sp. BR00000012568055]|uniref:hypothetical protein n=1 Tax=Caballeronia sp. BR00000012568055 TaxID=2918761 RepID=UPI0023FA479A|nr:hypothetical protein [Caballeronia sp. BR00000012568055]
MYSLKPFFVEIFPERVDGWIAEALFSRQCDYSKPIKVPKVTFRLGTVQPTKASAERDAIEWARRFIASSTDVLESSLKLEETRQSTRLTPCKATKL